MPNYKHQYRPAETLGESTDVRIERLTGTSFDTYRGSKEALVSIGIAPEHLFPGEPGMPLQSIYIWPIGAPRGSRTSLPGCLRITRNPSGTFVATLAVSTLEQQRRTAAREAKEREYKRAQQQALEQPAINELTLPPVAARLDPVFNLLVRELGVRELTRRIERLQREPRPAHAIEHLRLVWSAPEIGPSRLQ